MPSNPKRESPRFVVQQQHRPAAVLAFGDDALEVGALQAMVLGPYGEALLTRTRGTTWIAIGILGPR